VEVDREGSVFIDPCLSVTDGQTDTQPYVYSRTDITYNTQNITKLT